MREEGDDARATGGVPRATQVIDHVKRMIASGELRAGDRLPVEKVLAARWEVSRGSLREGVRALAALGVLETRQGDGTYVTQLDPIALLSPLGLYSELSEVGRSSDLLAVRRLLETEAAGLAARRITDEEVERIAALLREVDAMLASSEIEPQAVLDADAEFHRAIAAAGGNTALAALIGGLVSRSFRGRLHPSASEREPLAHGHAEHLDILSALRMHDPDRARIKMAAHLLRDEELAAADSEGAPPDAVGPFNTAGGEINTAGGEIAARESTQHPPDGDAPMRVE